MNKYNYLSTWLGSMRPRGILLSKLLALVVFSISIFTPLVGAQSSGPLTMEEDYKVWRSYRAVFDCLKDSGYDPNSVSSNPQHTLDNIFITGTSNPVFGDSNGSWSTGYIYNQLVGLDETYMDCNTPSDINPILGALGFSNGAYSFAEYLGDEPLTKDEVRTKLQERVTSLGGTLGLDSRPEFLYWIWRKIYRNPVNEYGCGGIVSNEARSNRNVNLNERTYYHVDDSGSGTPVQFSWANYNAGENANVNGVDRYLTREDSRPSCKQILNRSYGDRDRANAYAQYLRDNPQNADEDDSADGGEPAPPSCESEGGDMSWLMCGMLNIADSVVRTLDAAIMSLLIVPDKYINASYVEDAWRNIRTLAYIILVPVTLVMVISTAMGFEFISAYTVKRALPRLIIAAIFIAVSFDITKFLVTITNEIGLGVYGLVTNAFAGSSEITLASVFAPRSGTGAIAGTGLLVGAGIALAVGSIGVVLSFLLVMVVGLAMGFFLLALRQMLIIAAVIVAPLAILSWIFPGNDKLWKLWWNTFSKLLLLFPLIMLLLSIGRSFAWMVHNLP